MEIGYKLEKLIEELGESKGDFAKKLGIAQPTLSHYLKGTRKTPLDILKKIVEIYNLNPQYFFNESLDIDANDQEYDDDALELAQQLSEEGFGELNILFKKTGKLSKEEKEKVMKILRATLPENGND